MKIEFTDFGVDDASVLGFTAKDETKESLLTFQMPERFIPAPDLLGLAISTMAGKKYDQIVVDLPLTSRVQRVVEAVCETKLTAPLAALPQSAPPGRNGSLNFSGGFDSLAALTVSPENTKLISLDFGGNFQRETDFFKRFNPTTVKTNFRTQGFANNSWSFMGIGAILLRDYLEIGSYGFGSIIEAAPWNLNQTRYSNVAHPWYRAAGLKQMNPVQGLTEIGTVMLLAKHSPELIRDSLTSLAGPGSEKLNRKAMLLNIVDDRFGTGVRATLDRNEAHFKFGHAFATDFLTLYIIKRAGLDAAQQLVSDIPTEVVEFTKQHGLDFFERLNPIFCDNIPDSSRYLIYTRCLEAGIVPYMETDWLDYRAVASLLSKWHKGLV